MRASKNKKAARTNSTGCLFGTHKRIRTSDPSLRRRVLYPAELRRRTSIYIREKMFSDFTQSALTILRNPQATMQWYIVPLFLIVLYIVTKELHDKHYKVVLGGLALWGMDLFNEIWNSMVCSLSGFAPVWGTPAWVTHRFLYS